MACSGQFDFPRDMALGHFSRDAPGITDSAAVRSPEARPFLCAGVADPEDQREDDGKMERFHTLQLQSFI